MTANKPLLDRVEIPEPCTADWNAMKGTDEIRFCSECRKYVYNLSEMTRREAEALVSSRGNQMCARLMRDLEGETLTVDSPPPVRLFGWKPGPVATAFVSAIISITPCTPSLAKGQQASTDSSHSVDGSLQKSRRPTTGTMTAAVTGVVSNERGSAMPSAIVTLTSESTGEVLSQLTSQEGEYRFDGLPARTYIVEVRAAGYRLAAHHDVNLQQGDARRLDVAMEKLVQVGGAVSIALQPLRTLYQNSDRVVVAIVGKNAAEANERSAHLVKTSLKVSKTIKGDGDKPAIDVYNWVYGDQGFFKEGETVLAFLQRGEEASHGAKDGYTLVSTAESVKHLSASGLETYVQRLEELKAIIANTESKPADTVDWLVRCAEDPVTRHEGSFELNASAWREHWQKERASRLAAEGGPADSTSEPRDTEPLFSALLTHEQKERLMTALLKTAELGEADFELIELAKRWDDPRLLPFLVSYLRRSEETAPQSIERVMRSVAELLDDTKVSELLDEYSENATYEDLETEGDQAEDEDENDSGDEGDEVKQTPDAAKHARVAMLKAFLEAAEARIKLASAK